MVSLSPKTRTPKKMAVSGSIAPKIAVGVGPIYWMARAEQKKETAVGNNAMEKAHSHIKGVDGMVSGTIPAAIRTTNKNVPKTST